MGFLFQSEENVLKLDSSDVCITVNMPKTFELYFKKVNFVNYTQ